MDNTDNLKNLRENWRTLHRAMPSLSQESYTVEGLSHLLGIPRDIIGHEISGGQLRAIRSGHRTICIPREAVLDWLRERGPGV